MNPPRGRFLPRLAAAALLAPVLILASVATAEEGPFTFYWVMAQYEPTTVLHLFAPVGASAWIRNRYGEETGPFVVPAGETRSVRAADLSIPTNAGQRWLYYIEIRSDADLWIVGEKSFTDTYIAEPNLARPRRAFSSSWWNGAAASAGADDNFALYVPETTCIRFEIYRSDGSGSSVITGTFAPGWKLWDAWGGLGIGVKYASKVTADSPVAFEVFDVGGQTEDNLGARVSLSNFDRLDTDYAWIRYFSKFDALMPSGGSVDIRRPDGTAARTFSNLPETYGVWYADTGIPLGPHREVGTAPFAPLYPFPRTAEQTLSSATFFGFDAKVSRLLLLGPDVSPATVTLTNALDPTRRTIRTVAARSAEVLRASDLGLGFAETGPFLLAVEAERPLFMSVELDRMCGYLRPYPLWKAAAPSDFASCFRIKVPQTGRKVGGNVLHVVGDVCHETGSPVAARTAIASARFQYRVSGSMAWTDIPPMNSDFPNPDPDRPWHIHWDVSALPETTVHLRAVATDTAGRVDPYPSEITVEIDRANPEIRSEREAGGRSRVTALVESNRPTEVAGAGDGGRTVRIVLPQAALAMDDRIVAEILPPASPELDTGFPAGILSVGEIRRISLASGVSRLGETVDLYLSYADADGDGLVDGTPVAAGDLRGFSRGDTGGAWTPVETVDVDTAAREVHLRTNHFTLFALAAAPMDGPLTGGSCLAERLGVPAGLLGLFRRWRDDAMASPAGRALSDLYYRAGRLL